jgi:hypothetical protein
MARRSEPVGPLDGPRRKKIAAFRLGLSAESRAAMVLVAKGYRIVARRWKTPFGEIDIKHAAGARLFSSRSKRASAPMTPPRRSRNAASAASSPQPSFGWRTIRLTRSAKFASTSCW